MTTYTAAILQLIDKNPGISSSDIHLRLGLKGRDVAQLIRPYLERGLIVVSKRQVEGERKILRTFSSTGKLRDLSPASRRTAYKKWTTEDLQTLTRLYPDNSNSSIAKVLGRTLKQTESKAKKLKLQKSEERVKKFTFAAVHWSAQDVRILQNLYGDRKAAELADLLGKTEYQIRDKARKLQLKKSVAFLKGCGSHFQPVHKMGVSKAGPVGTESVASRYVRVKVAEPHVWEYKHQLVWRSNRGEYNTKTHTLWFIDRNPMNCDISNLELITKSEMMRRTSIMKYPKELRDVITLHNKLKRKLHEQHRDVA